LLLTQRILRSKAKSNISYQSAFR